MSTVTSTPVRHRGPAGDHRRFAHEAAQARRDRAQARQHDHERIIALLGRGCGITQILSEIARPGDRLTVQVARALQVRRTLDAIAEGAPSARGVTIARETWSGPSRSSTDESPTCRTPWPHSDAGAEAGCA